MLGHGLRTTGGEIAFTARQKINSHSQIFRYGRSIFCLPHLPEISDFFDLCFHWMSVVRILDQINSDCSMYLHVKDFGPNNVKFKIVIWIYVIKRLRKVRVHLTVFAGKWLFWSKKVGADILYVQCFCYKVFTSQ